MTADLPMVNYKKVGKDGKTATKQDKEAHDETVDLNKQAMERIRKAKEAEKVSLTDLMAGDVELKKS